MGETDIPLASQEERSRSARGMLSALNAWEASSVNMNSFLLIRNGAVLQEGYWSPYRADLPHALHSVTKGLVSMAVGLLVEDGLLTLDTPVLPFFPDYPVASEGAWDALTVRHLLTMTCGQEKVPAFLNRNDYLEAFFSEPLKYAPGTHFCYNNLCTYMLCSLLKRITGQNLPDFLNPRVLWPAGIMDFTCGTSPTGISHGSSAGFLSTQSMGKLGMLWLNKGKAGIRQLLPESWIEQASSSRFRDSIDPVFPDNPFGSQGYGYHLWRCGQLDAYRFDGFYGQYIIVIPEKNTVIVTTASEARPDIILDICFRHIIPALEAEPDPEALREVDRRLAALEVPGRAGIPWNGSSDYHLAFPPNRESFLPSWLLGNRSYPDAFKEFDGIHSLCLSFTEDSLVRIRLFEGRMVNSWQVKVGEGSGQEEIYHTFIEDYRVFLSSRWESKEIFVLEMRFLNYAHHCTIRILLSGSEARLWFHELPNQKGYLAPAARELTALFEK